MIEIVQLLIENSCNVAFNWMEIVKYAELIKLFSRMSPIN